MSEQQHPLLIRTGDDIIPVMAEDPSSPLGLRLPTVEEITAFHQGVATVADPGATMPEGFQPASPEAIANKKRELMVELLSPEELLDKIETDREARDKAERDEAITRRWQEIARSSEAEHARLEIELSRMQEERRILDDASALTARSKNQRTAMLKRADERRARMAIRRDEVRQHITSRSAAGAVAVAEEQDAIDVSRMIGVMRMPLAPFIWMIALMRMIARFIVRSYEYASGDTPQRRLVMNAQNAILQAQRKEAERTRDSVSTKRVAGPRIERDPRIVEIIARAERLLINYPDLADEGNARIDDLVRTHLPRLEERRRSILELGAPSAVIDAGAMVEKALATAEISIAQAVRIASKIHLDGMDTEIRFLEMRTPDDGSNPTIAPLPEPVPAEVASVRRKEDAETRDRSERRTESLRRELTSESYAGRMVAHCDYDTYGSSCYDGGGSSSGDW